MKRLVMPATSLTMKIALLLVACTVFMLFTAAAQTPQQIKADPGTNTGPPAGAILDLNGTPIPGGGTGTYQPYTVNFQATLNNTAITFALRDDPAFISLANVTVRDVTNPDSPGPNVLVNGDFSAGTFGTSTPLGWSYANVYGATFGGLVETGSGDCYTLPNCYFDGAVQAYDAISQAIATTPGHTYQISFEVAEDVFQVRGSCVFDSLCVFSDTSTNGVTGSSPNPTLGNGINVAVYAEGGAPPIDSQTHTLEPGVQTIYSFDGGENKDKITSSQYSLGGEDLTVSEVLIRQSAFVPPANFPNETCIPVEPWSTNLGAPTCVEYQWDCSYGGQPGGGDCNTLLYTVLDVYDLPSGVAIGGPDLLVVHGKGCPTINTDVAVSIFTDYFVARQDPTSKGSGIGTGSCFIKTYTPTAPLITSGSSSTFVGWLSPVVDSDLNEVKAGATRPLAFSWSDSAGNPITNLSYCNSFIKTNSGNVCQDNPNVNPTPWVNMSYFQIACPGVAPLNTQTDTNIPGNGNSGLQKNGGGNYQINWQTLKSFKGKCYNVQATFDNGVAVVPAVVGFKFN